MHLASVERASGNALARLQHRFSVRIGSVTPNPGDVIPEATLPPPMLPARAQFFYPRGANDPPDAHTLCRVNGLEWFSTMAYGPMKAGARESVGRCRFFRQR